MLVYKVVAIVWFYLFVFQYNLFYQNVLDV